MEKLVFDGKEAVFGRLATVVAKNLLKGNSVDVINCEDIIISGNKQAFFNELVAKKSMGGGSSLKGPNYSRLTDKLIRRMIRGMLPWDRPKGKDAYKRLRCYIGRGKLTEEDLKKVKSFEENRKPMKYFSIKEITGALRWIR